MSGAARQLGKVKGAANGTRTRDANRTRADLVAAATELFSRHAYDQVGVRAIAERAGVNQALLNRYFQSKAGLFRVVVEEMLADTSWLEGDSDAFGARFASHLCAKADDEIDPLLLIVRSTTHPEAALIVREALEEKVIGPLAQRLAGQDARARAAALVAVLVGASVVSTLVRLPSATMGYQDKLAATLQAFIDDRA